VIVREPDNGVDVSFRRVHNGDPQYRALGVSGVPIGQDRWEWTVVIPGAEFIRVEPWVSQLRTTIENAMRLVPGVMEVRRDDREVWVAIGDPDGEELSRAVAIALDEVVDRLLEEPDR